MLSRLSVFLLSLFASSSSSSSSDDVAISKPSSDEFFHLATINYGHLESSHPYIRHKAETQLLHALENIGFIVLTNHGMDRFVMDSMWNDTISFFDSSSSNKNSVPMTAEYMYGYSADEILSRSETESGHGYANDNKETFQAWIGAAGTGRDAAVRWPEYPTNLQTSWTAYYRECERLASRLLAAMARILDLDEIWFEDKISDHMSALRALNYPVQASQFDAVDAVNGEENIEERRSLRCSPHSDYGTLTLLRQDGVGGLQVEREGKWLDVVSDHYDFIVNLGDLMQRWTNERFKSTRHRVVNPRGAKVAGRRQSVAFFHNLNENALVETIPSCLDENGKSKYPAIRFRDFLEMKHHSTQTHYEHDPTAAKEKGEL